MNLTIILPSIVTVIYAITGICYAYKYQWDWATVWLGYAVANIGLIIAGNAK